MIFLRPSGSSIWTKCAANPKISAATQFVPEESDAAREGTCAAWVADCVLKGDAASCADMLGETHPENGWLVTSDMVHHVQGYVNAVRKRGTSVSAEQRVNLSPTIGGTFDSSNVSYSGDTLYVDDLKYGYGIVEVDTPQLVIYGKGELIRLNNPDIRYVVLSIYQPRAWHVDGIHRSTPRMTVEELNVLADWVIVRGELCQAVVPIATPGKHCEHCKGASECEALARSVYSAFTVIEGTRQGRMNAEELAKELDFLELCEKLVKARKTAVDAEGEQRIKSGEYVQGWGMKDKYGHRKFKFPLAIVKTLTGIDPYKQKPLTPAEMESEGASPDIINTLSSAPFVGRKLGRVTSKDIGKMFEK